MKALDRLQAILSRLFRLDESTDLDFGIYRLINMKREYLTEYLNKRLPQQVAEVLEQTSQQDRDAKLVALEEASEKVLDGLGASALDEDGNLLSNEATPIGQNYLTAQREAQDLKASAEMEEEIYDHLATFFSRYECGGGDVVPHRHHSVRGRYAMPHDGEEVLLHWANWEQHYIKSFAYHPGIAVKLGGQRFVFRITDMQDIPRDNNKDSGRFLLPQIDAIGKNTKSGKASKGDIVIPFTFRNLNKKEQGSYTALANGENGIGGNGGKVQAGILAEALTKLIKAATKEHSLAPLLVTDDAGTTAFMRHARSFVRRNSADFFIHQDLGRFLGDELDLYLKSEMLQVNDLLHISGSAVASRMVIFRAVHKLGKDIIDALVQWENLQKALWEKKKFVLQTDYCIPLGKIPNLDVLLDTIAGNKNQWAEWKALGLSGSATPLFNNGSKRDKRLAWLRENPSLPVDTAHFPPEFKDELLAQFTDIDEATDGVLIHGENWQALNLIQEMYRSRVKCVYIDPPYNTDASAILYKNDYKHSSWLSMMDGRLSLTPPLMTPDGILCVAIDDEEQPYLRLLLSTIFPYEVGNAVVRSNPAGRKTRGRLAPAHEYAMFWGMSSDAVPGSLEKTEKALSRYPLKDERGNFAWANLIRSGTDDLREDSPTLFYPIYVSPADKIRIPDMKWDEEAREWVATEPPRKGETVVLPIQENGNGLVEKRWHRGHERVSDEPKEYRVRRDSAGNITVHFKTRMDTESAPVTWWGEKKYASANMGAIVMKRLFSDKPFDFAKAIGLVEDCIRTAGLAEGELALDYFGGSGTTAHAVMNLNREDGGQRKFVLVEAGEYFNTVVLPRVKKVIYSPEWKDGQPIRPAAPDELESGPCLVKYQRFESYEDALANIGFESDEMDLLARAPRYNLKWDTRGSPTWLLDTEMEDPFGYTLELMARSNGNGADSITEHVDLPETFAYLLGLRVKTRRIVMDGKRRYLVHRGLVSGKDTVVLWRDITGWTKADFKREQDFVTKAKLVKGADRILLNCHTALNQGESLNSEFGRRMFAED